MKDVNSTETTWTPKTGNSVRWTDFMRHLVLIKLRKYILPNVADKQFYWLTKYLSFLYQVLQVQITNELDPFFFYSLEVNEDDFQSLKVEQCILVDFATFPYKFIELLEQCIVSSCTENPRFVTCPLLSYDTSLIHV